MLLISVLVRPCKAFIFFKSLGLVTTTSSPSFLISISTGSSLTRVPFGPVTVTLLFSAISTVTPAGIATGSLPIRDIPLPPTLKFSEKQLWLLCFQLLSGYQTNAKTSPPTLSFLASLSVITP
jgi:hypothetical protein